jgi:hypothetical protein
MQFNLPGRVTTLSAIGLVAAMLAVGSARAMEPRPWLCRDKPVFSWNLPMNYEISARPGSEWRMFFMQFDPNAAHDGFAIVRSLTLSSRSMSVRGTLDAGRYFAVALRRRGNGLWICPGYARESPSIKPGIVAKLCYGESGSACDINLLVTPQQTHTGSQTSGN